MIDVHCYARLPISALPLHWSVVPTLSVSASYSESGSLQDTSVSPIRNADSQAHLRALDPRVMCANLCVGEAGV